MSPFKDSHESLPPLQHLQWLALLKSGVHILGFKILHNRVQAQTPVPTGLMCPVLGSVAQSCLMLRRPLDCSLPGSSIHGICQARMLEWVAMSCSRQSSWPRDRTCISCVSCIGRWVLYNYCHLGSPQISREFLKLLSYELFITSFFQGIFEIEECYSSN